MDPFIRPISSFPTDSPSLSTCHTRHPRNFRQPCQPRHPSRPLHPHRHRHPCLSWHPCFTPVTTLMQPCQTCVTPLFHLYNTPVTVIQSCRPLHFLADFYLKSKLYSSTSATYTVYRGSRGLERQFRFLIDRFPCSARGLCIRAPTSLQGNNVIALFVAIIKNDNI